MAAEGSMQKSQERLPGARDIYERTTEGVRVRVRPEFRKDQSDPRNGYYVWLYHVEIVNESPRTVILRTRHWIITDAQGRVTEVRGAGVVGEQPILRPGERFEYTSGTPLKTPSGFMHGFYEMEDAATGARFRVAIPPFSLDSPHAENRLH